MFSFKVGGKEYKIKFGYKVLSESDVLLKASDISNIADPRSLIALLPELILIGLQTKHKDEFGYETEEEKKVAFGKVCDLLDNYEDESTEEHPHDGFTLFQKVNDELEKNGFLSGILKMMEEAEKNQKVTKMPQDHKKKS